ncbi:MAG: hypothetical protein ABFD94_15035, partial [Armatimonadia bacterium]
EEIGPYADFGAGKDLQGDLLGAETLVEARGQGADQVGIRVLVGIVHMRRGGDDLCAISHGKAGDRKGLVHIARAIIHAGQDVAVQIDHKGDYITGRGGEGEGNSQDVEDEKDVKDEGKRGQGRNRAFIDTGAAYW